MLFKKGLTLFGASLVVFLLVILPTASFFNNPPAPHVTGISFSSTGPYVTGDVIKVSVTFDRAMTVTGTPRVRLNIGGTTRYANYRSGARTLVFHYTVAADDTDNNGVYINSNSLELNGGTIRWVPVGNQQAQDGQLGHGSVGPNSDHAVNKVVDSTAPTITSIGFTSTGPYSTGDVIEVTVTFSEL